MKDVSRIARVDLDKETSDIVELEDSLLRKYIGGVGLASKIISKYCAETSAFIRSDRMPISCPVCRFNVP